MISPAFLPLNHAFGVDDHPRTCFPVPFLEWVPSTVHYWVTFPKRRRLSCSLSFPGLPTCDPPTPMHDTRFAGAAEGPVWHIAGGVQQSGSPQSRDAPQNAAAIDRRILHVYEIQPRGR